MTIEQLNAMKQRLSERKSIPELNMEGICIATMEAHQMDWRQLTRKSNIHHAVKCREQLAYLIYTYVTGSTYEMIGQLMQRSHATILHNVRQSRKFMDIEPLYKQQVESILERAKQWENENNSKY
jgi:chromosomal replication initiation ATPase DnaA